MNCPYARISGNAELISTSRSNSLTTKVAALHLIACASLAN
ncbi:MAG: hypothetical protein ACHBN1_15850 [Heteroscytonema crispum UTEX LB 1556]